MKKILILSLLFISGWMSAQAVDLNKENRDPEYVKSIVGRSQKIVDKLGLTDAKIAEDVRNVIANRYFELNDIYEVRDAKVKKVKESGLTGEAKNEALKAAENEKDAVKKFQQQIEDAKKDPKKKISSTIVVKKKGDGSTHTMGQPPKIIVDSYPPEGMYTFKGVVRVFTTIGEDGKVKKTKVAVTSGRRGVDELAMAFCRRWTFKPALDSKGQPMECIKLIRIPFNLPPEKMKDQIDRNT